MAELFISYSKANRPQALELARELRAEGFSVWIDQGGIEGAQNWSAKIVEGITDCTTLVLLLSPEAVASRNVAREVHIAFEKRKNILPVIIEKAALPANFEYSLAGLQRLYYHDRPAIFSSLKLLRSGVEAAGQLPQREALEREDTSIRVAVLPFDDLSQQRDNQWFADGMMDELISTLGHLDRVKVPSRSDVLHYRDHRIKSKDIANELGVRYLIEGAVRKAGEKIRINATLIDSRQNEQLWGNQFNGTFDDIFAFQESVAKHIMEALKLQLTPQEAVEIEAHPTQNLEAYELYLKGKHEQYYYTKESYLRALDLYEKAAALDPKFEQAHLALATLCAVYYREYSKDPRWLTRAEHSVAKAEEVAGETSRSLSIHGMIAWFRGDQPQAISLLTHSTKLDPKNYRAFNILGNLYMAMENNLAAIEAFQRVVDVTEDTMSYFNLLGSLNDHQHTDRLIGTAKKALPLFDRYLLREPNDWNVAVSRAFVLLWAGRGEDALEKATALVECEDLSGYALKNLAGLFNDLGKPQIFLSLLRRAIEKGYRETEQMRNLANEITDPSSQRELQLILDELDEIVRLESSSSIT